MRCPGAPHGITWHSTVIHCQFWDNMTRAHLCGGTNIPGSCAPAPHHLHGHSRQEDAGAWHSIGRVPGCPEPTPWQEWLSWCLLLGHRSSWLDALQPLAQLCQHLPTVTEEKHIPLPPDGISCFAFLLKWCPLPPMLAGTAGQSLAPLALSPHAVLEGGWAEIILSLQQRACAQPSQHAAHSVLSSQHWTPQRVRPQDGLSFSLLPWLSGSSGERAAKSPVPRILSPGEVMRLKPPQPSRELVTYLPHINEASPAARPSDHSDTSQAATRPHGSYGGTMG